ncbi:APC family permease [Methanohalophilus profundi]|uniref:APC family permease n=1 Tax=Methanohalophilus profundi TaxID=2138083 RepID=UPI00101C5566|nr:APC family permease [Methanohalophilus profundi]
MVEYRKLERAITWKTGVFVALTCVLDWFWLTGTAIDMSGKWAIAAWATAVLLQGVACIGYLEMATMFRDSSGGLPTYVHEAFKKYSPLPGTISSWGYVVGWGAAPIAVVLFAGFFVRETLLPSMNPTVFAVIILLSVCLLNYFGVKVWSNASTFIVITALICLSICVGNWLFPIPESVNPVGFGYVGENPGVPTFIATVFILAWSAYSSEVVITLTAEYKNPVEDTKKALFWTILLFLFGTTFVAATYLKALPLDTILNHPYTPLLPLAEHLIGYAGKVIVTIAMVVGLFLSTNACLIAASRVLFQMGRSGTTLKQFGHLNRYGSPAGAIFGLALLNIAMITIFGDQPIAILRAGDIGYFGTIILANISFIMLRRDRPNAERGFRAPNFYVYICALLAITNLVIVTVGSWEWGLLRSLIGASLLLTCLPFYFYRTKVQDRREIKGDNINET